MHKCLALQFRGKMTRRYIHINVSIAFNTTKEANQVIEHTISGHSNKKIRVITNTVASLAQLRPDTESWLVLYDAIRGEVLIIQGDL